MTEAEFDDAELFEPKPPAEASAPVARGSWKIETFQERSTGDCYQVCRAKGAWRNVGKEGVVQKMPPWQKLE